MTIVPCDVTWGVGKFAPNLPDGFALVVTQADFDEKGFLGGDERPELTEFATHGALLAIQLDDQVSPAAPQALAPGALESGGERERIRELQRSGQEAGGLDCVARGN